MRLYAPLYEGDNHQRPDAAMGEAIARIFNTSASAASFVHSNIENEATMKAAPDLQEIEICARAARSAWIARILSSMRRAVGDWLARLDNSERDNFFAGAANRANLAQQRRRDFARAELTRYLFTDC